MTNAPSRQAIEGWLRSALAPLLNLDAAAIDGTRPFAAYGLDSITAMTLAADLEVWLGCRLPPTLAWEHPTLDRLATHIALLASAEPDRTASEDAAIATLTDVEVDAQLRRLLDADGTGS
jgi:acyl carrier protein